MEFLDINRNKASIEEVQRSLKHMNGVVEELCRIYSQLMDRMVALETRVTANELRCMEEADKK